MNQGMRKRLTRRTAIIKALAHPTRLYIIEKLLEHEHCVCELKDLIGVDISTVSKHLSVLKNAGLVSDDKRGLQVYYSIRVPCILHFLECVESVVLESEQEDNSDMSMALPQDQRVATGVKPERTGGLV